MSKHERCQYNPNQYVKHYAERLGRLAVNTALTVKHEVWPPKPEAPIQEPLPNFPKEDSELVILDDENAVIRVEE